MRKKKLISFKKLQLPWLYKKALHLFEEAEKDKDTITNRELVVMFNRKFKLTKDDIKKLVKELKELGVLRRVNKRKLRFEGFNI